MIKNLRKKGFVLSGTMIIVGIIAFLAILAAILIPILLKGSSTKTQDNLDIAAAQIAIEDESYVTTQIEAPDTEKALIKAQELVNTLGAELKETTATVIAGTFNIATDGTADNPYGGDGSYTFTVKITKGKGTEVISVEKIMIIIATPYVSELVELISIGNIIGAAEVGVELQAGTINPALATINYQWKIANTLNGSYTNISGETTSKYTIIVADTGKFIKVEATGTGTYINKVISVATTAVVDLTDYTENSNLSPLIMGFDKNVEVQEDIVSMIAFGKNANNSIATLSKLKSGDVLLVEDIDYILFENTLTIKKEYLVTKDLGAASITAEFSAGENLVITINVIDSSDYTENSTISLKVFDFDKNIDLQKDIVTTISFGKNANNTIATLSNLRAGDVLLVEDTDYIPFGNSLTIKIEYLMAKDLGTIEISVEFSAGENLVITINVIDSTDYTENSTISLKVFDFDKKIDLQKDIVTTISFGKNADNTIATLSDLRSGDVLLVEDTDYILFENSLIIKKEYLVTKNIGTVLIEVEFSAGENLTVSINVIDTTDYTENSTISPKVLDFDKKTSLQKDIITTITLGKNADNSIATLLNVKIGEVLLIENTDYIVASNKLTFKKEYLITKDLGAVSITIVFSAGENSTLLINIIDSTDYTVDSTISLEVFEFDKKLSLQKGIVTTITFGKNVNNTIATLSQLKAGDLLLTENTDYILFGNTLTIKKEYLSSKNLGTIEISVEFSAGNAAILTVNVIDTTDYTVNSSISLTTAVFDKKIEIQADIATLIIFGKNANNTIATLSNVKIGETALIKDADYLLSGNTLTIKKEYLMTLNLDEVSIIVEFSAGISSSIMVNVVDTTDYTENSIISPALLDFDKHIEIYDDIFTVISFGKNYDNTIASLVHLKRGDVILTEDTDYMLVGNILTIKKEYLGVLSLGIVEISIEFSAGNSAILTVNIIDTTDYTEDSSISVTSADFDKNVAGQTDINTTITFGKNANNTMATLANVKNGEFLIIEDTDYILSGNILTIKKEYLSTLNVGLVEINIEFSAGVMAALVISVVDTTDYTEDSSVSPESESFNKEIDFQVDVAFLVTFGKNANNTTAALLSLKVNTLSLTLGTDYSLDGNSLTIKKEYLATKAVGELVVNVEFSAGAEFNVTITINDTTPLPPSGDLLDSVASSDFLGILYKRDGNVYYKEQDSSGRWSVETLIGIGTEGKISIDNNDNFHVVYTTENKIGYKIYDGSNWTEEVLIESLNIGGTGSCSKPDIAVDNNGKAHITYTDSYGSGDDISKPDIMYTNNLSGVFEKTLIFRGYQDYSSSGSWAGSYFTKGSIIALNDNGDYFITAYNYSIWKWYNGSDKSYSLQIASNLGSGGISTASSADAYDATSSGGKVLIAYMHGSFKISEIAVSGSTTTLTNTTNITTSSVSRFSVSGSNVVVGGISSGKLQIQYNGSIRTYADISVKGTEVSIIKNNDGFYAVYTDSIDSIVKKKLIEAPEIYTVTFAPGTTGNDLSDITGATNYVAIDVATEGISFVAPELSISGYTFEGWFTDPEGSTAYIPSINAITADIILYAKFTTA